MQAANCIISRSAKPSAGTEPTGKMTLRFTLRQIHYFVAIAESGSIARASDQLNISPPSLSTAVAQLEASLGIRLFIRQHSLGLSLTSDGRRFLGEAKQLLQQASAMHRSASEISRELRGPLSVGCHVTFAPMLLPTVRRAFEAAHPNIAWSSAVGDQSALVERLRRGEIDVALAYDFGIPRDLAFEPLARLSAHVILPAGHPFAARHSVCLGDLAELPLVLLDQPFYRDYFVGLFAAAGLEPTIADSVGDNNLLRAMVATGLGYSLSNVRPANHAAADGGAIVMKPLDDEHLPVTIGVASAVGGFRPKVVAAFSAQCRRLIRDDAIPGMAPPPEGEIAAPQLSLAG
jgi:DNA-binding transcriptional LysR family regulator